MIEKKLIETIADKYGLNHIDSIIRLEGGERNKVYKISNLDLVIRIYQPTALLEGILFEHRLMSLLSKQMACVVEPLLYGHDNSYFIFEACPVAVLPYINGVKPTHNDCKESAFCYKAGCILGQMHRIAMENKDDFPTLISRIPLIQMNPYSNHLYNWEKAVKYLSLTDFNAELPYNTMPPYEFLDEIGAVLIDDNVEMRLTPEDFIASDTHGVSRLVETDFSAFAVYHDKRNPDMYWTSERIKNEVSRWGIFLLSDKQIIGYILLAMWDMEQAEIFVVTAADGIQYKAMITASVMYAFSNGRNSILFMADKNTIEYEAALAVGFKATGQYKGYKAHSGCIDS